MNARIILEVLGSLLLYENIDMLLNFINVRPVNHGIAKGEKPICNL